MFYCAQKMLSPFAFVWSKAAAEDDVGAEEEEEADDSIDEMDGKERRGFQTSTPLAGEKKAPAIRGRIFTSPVRVRSRGALGGTPTAVVGPRKADHSALSNNNDSNHSSALVSPTAAHNKRSIGALASPGLYTLCDNSVSYQETSGNQFYLSFGRPTMTRHSASPVRRSVSAGVNAMLNQQSTSLIHYNSGTLVDESVSPLDQQRRISRLEEKIDSLQTQIQHTNNNNLLGLPPNSPLRASFSCPKIHYTAVAQFSAEEPDAVSVFHRAQKEINTLRDKLECSERYRQIEISEHNAREAERRTQIDTYKSRVSELNAECKMWQEKAATVSPMRRQCSLVEQRACQLASEIARLKEDNKQLRKGAAQLSSDEVKDMCNAVDFLQLKYEAACTSLEFKEAECLELNEALMEKGGSAAGVSSPDGSLKAALSGQSTQLTKCLFMAKCLQHTAHKLIKGETPNINRLLGCRSDSMSDSESSNQSAPKTSRDHLAINQSTLDALEKKLTEAQNGLIDFYAKQMADDVSQQQSCKMQ